MLDSPFMGENDQKPRTLASLRSRSQGVRRARPAPVQPELLFSDPTPPAEPAPPRPATPRLASIPAKPERRVWTVRALVTDIRQRVELGYADLWVEGEISNCRSAPSGHLYLTLKDGDAQISVVLFRREASLLRFRPTDGLAVLVRGRLSIYETRGQLQLIAETMEPRGVGALQLAFDQLKARLLAEGLFDASRKRSLPAFPHCIGVITSPTGAVVRDIVNVVRRRHARLNLLIHPAVMQGPNCPGSVARAIRWFNANPGRVDLIVIARGGGSFEDLAGFNHEGLARAIAASTLPVVSAIGHETDFTIADFVSDLRAPTPSAAAELVTAAQHRIEERVEQLHRAVLRAGQFRLLQARQRLARLSAEHVLTRLRDAIFRRSQRLDDLGLRLHSAIDRRNRQRRIRLETLTARLHRHAPAVRLAGSRHRLAAAQTCMQHLSAEIVTRRAASLSRASAHLQALSPVAVLSRGYALVYAEDEAGASTLLRSTANVTPGQRLRARLGSGSLAAQVLEIDPQ